MVDPNGFLMIEPKNQANKTVIDDLTCSVTALLRTAEDGQAWFGYHECICGAYSGNVDLWVEISGKKYLTNSLAAHYAACHRDEIPQQQMKLIETLKGTEEPTVKDLYGWKSKLQSRITVAKDSTHTKS
jgi:hypothetical protein